MPDRSWPPKNSSCHEMHQTHAPVYSVVLGAKHQQTTPPQHCNRCAKTTACTKNGPFRLAGVPVNEGKGLSLAVLPPQCSTLKGWPAVEDEKVQHTQWGLTNLHVRSGSADLVSMHSLRTKATKRLARLTGAGTEWVCWFGFLQAFDSWQLCLDTAIASR